MDFETLIRDVPDFPRPGILFKDITPLLGHGAGFAAAIRHMAEPWRAAGIEVVAGIEARGFILGAALARELGAGFVPIRKPGKLPGRTLGADYALEYGSDRLEVHADAVASGTRVLLVDDVLATGGTLAASRRLVEGVGADLAGAMVLIELAALRGRERWSDTVPLRALLRY
ncbi:adenine phosphoribosyltransferase [Rehaibacterium terrae]|uniref:Adenine phosphoribosyltransferase n=2 Tax=Rehaibacterium terrae TaxID=1341696 RepID=A0A7W7Y1U2_9GAMM|nr:adenine phosphoribosyltransferase [Rehaibacterium terrae]